MKKIPVRALHQEVAHRIREMIRKGDLRIGQRIPEQDMCHALGVSRTPLREALRTLSSEGLVDLIPNRGAYVTQPSMEEIRDMFEVMGVLEGMCARIAAQRMAEEDVSQLRKLHEQLEERYRDRDPEGYIRVNNRYHTMIQELTGNKVLIEIIHGLRQKILLYRYRQIYQPNRLDESVQEHRGLIEAFEKRDGELAEARMKRHLERQCEALVAVYRDRP